ncbi:hypothetical protein VN97_g12968 [Penicillium thymicola]|uniref:Uncharacterized protein n=1 Tax=Penicillium thymicola TaxID=293382 RepID=A0AAI9X242_PENTH|nr:hypothetical protein VN97_g12968 [Penicillium thymicola]
MIEQLKAAQQTSEFQLPEPRVIGRRPRLVPPDSTSPSCEVILSIVQENINLGLSANFAIAVPSAQQPFRLLVRPTRYQILSRYQICNLSTY